ncbi:hypothetical protein HUW46_09543 [Amycolatopsis sp. CA-230715]|nr:hypothetical protein HUW46_09543 [Amycolatopsis sp. CA-230715]
MYPDTAHETDEQLIPTQVTTSPESTGPARDERYALDQDRDFTIVLGRE